MEENIDIDMNFAMDDEENASDSDSSAYQGTEFPKSKPLPPIRASNDDESVDSEEDVKRIKSDDFGEHKLLMRSVKAVSFYVLENSISNSIIFHSVKMTIIS